MTANQRRSGFRLPWVADDGSDRADAAGQTVSKAAGGDVPKPTPTAAAATTPAPPAPAATGQPMPARQAGASSDPAPSDPAPATPSAEASPADVSLAGSKSAASQPTTTAPPAQPEPPNEFMRDLVAAMRSVADQARHSGLEDLKRQVDEHVERLEAASEERAADLRQRAEADVSGIGEWATAETERIRKEAEGRVSARREQLEQQLAGERRRSDEEASGLRGRIADYERELEAYHAQLAEINDPAAFAAAAKRMPRAPELSLTAARVAPEPLTPAPASEATAVVEPQATGDANGAGHEAAPSNAALAGRLAELDASLEPATAVVEPSADPAAAESAPAVAAGSATTSVMVKGLASFGAITGFRQALAGVDGVDSVQLSLGPTGEFVYRAVHRDGFDLGAAIIGLEGDAAQVSSGDDGTLHVTISRAR